MDIRAAARAGQQVLAKIKLALIQDQHPIVFYYYRVSPLMRNIVPL